MVIFTSSARGSIDSIVPTGTPTIADLVTGIQPDRGGEVADDLVAAAARPHQIGAHREKDGKQDGQRQPQPAVTLL